MTHYNDLVLQAAATEVTAGREGKLSESACGEKFREGADLCQENAPFARPPRRGEENMIQSWVGRGIVLSLIIMATGHHVLLLLSIC